ncbi:MAG: hypothetical protein ABWK01_05450, partial [Infirmifilum sp.]
MSSKYILGILALAIIALALAHTAQAAPITKVNFTLNLPDGTPFANQQVIIVVFNETGNCILAHAIGTTDSNGFIKGTIDQPGGAINPANSGTYYNISVFWQAYGRTFLANTTVHIDSNTFNNLFNQPTITVNLGLLWKLKFQAMTNVAGQDVPLYFKDPESGREDIAYFDVWFYSKSGAPVFSSPADSTATSTKSFLAPTVEVNIKPTTSPTCYHIEKAWNVTLYKEVSWLLNTNPGQPLKVLVGRENVIIYA